PEVSISTRRHRLVSFPSDNFCCEFAYLCVADEAYTEPRHCAGLGLSAGCKPPYPPESCSQDRRSPHLSDVDWHNCRRRMGSEMAGLSPGAFGRDGTRNPESRSSNVPHGALR